jgi:hypothetical protein
VLRGGSWGGVARFVRCARRFAIDPGSRAEIYGFRPIARGPASLQGLLDAAVDALAAEVDAVLREAISRHLGRGDWTLDEVRGHVVRQVDLDHPLHETVFYDGVPIVRLYPYRHRVEGGVIYFYRPYSLVPGKEWAGRDRVVRGGNWDWLARGCRSAYRSGGVPGHRLVILGFRPVARRGPAGAGG